MTLKHFACNNQEDNRHASDSLVNERALREIYLRAFEICVREADPKAMMTSYNLINGTYAPDRRDLCTDVLRNEWGFHGVVMTDWDSTMKGWGTNAEAIEAGNDMMMPGGPYFIKDLKDALKSGKLSKEALLRAARNLIRNTVHSQVAEKIRPEELL